MKIISVNCCFLKQPLTRRTRFTSSNLFTSRTNMTPCIILHAGEYHVHALSHALLFTGRLATSSALGPYNPVIH